MAWQMSSPFQDSPQTAPWKPVPACVIPACPYSGVLVYGYCYRLVATYHPITTSPVHWLDPHIHVWAVEHAGSSRTKWEILLSSDLSQEVGIPWLPRQRHSHLSPLLPVAGWVTWLGRDDYFRWLSLVSWGAGSTQPQTAEETINNLSLPN